MKNHDRLVYSPRTGSVYLSGENITNYNFDNPMEFIGVQKVATLKEQAKTFKANTEGLKSTPGLVTYKDFEINYVAGAKENLKQLVARKQLVEVIQSEGYSAKGYMAAQQLQQLDAAIGGAGQEEVSPIRVIPLIRKILGVRPNIFFVEQGFSTVNVEKLDARVPEQDTRRGQVKMNPLEKVDFDKLKFSEDRFNLKKNTHATLLPSETSKRADFNVMQLNSTDATISFARMRNGMALQALSAGDGTLVNDDASMATFSISDPEATGASAIPHGAFNAKKELLQQFQDFLDDNEAQVTTTFWNPIDYARYESNYDVHGIDRGVNAVVSGVVQLAGIPDVIAILDRAVPLGMFYAVDSQAALKGEGPFETEFWREYSRDADAFVMRDYVQFLVPNPNRYVRKIQIAGVGNGRFSAARQDEIITDAQLDTYVAGTQNLLDKAATP